ncbi:hypothetical protein F442_13005 [Phytophthora nicotianae P10297]|uniref:Uncharacterized protein n=3 Tax=Phytophthora nicotianae TaxID=4792 RepID=V9EQX3_PHYNI|nr:hypothetical protein F443_13122 [Phytophthora nicotianae P1569]ETM41595.1 hypothetical protein L914_12642 [Phytophthora nicotianae]ETP39532.1 hypothetical protein F442_13005 [Phytophthora nicotianae P10297]
MEQGRQRLVLGVAGKHELFMATMATSVRLSSSGHALVTANVVGDIGEDATVLVEGALGLPPA